LEDQKTLDLEPVELFSQAGSQTKAKGNQMSDQTLIKQLKVINKDLKKRVKVQRSQQRNLDKHIQKINRSFVILHPNQEVLEAITLLIDDDLVWSGDFDDLRHPIANLMIKAETMGLFKEDLAVLSKTLLLK
jgi:hypothetical protein